MPSIPVRHNVRVRSTSDSATPGSPGESDAARGHGARTASSAPVATAEPGPARPIDRMARRRAIGAALSLIVMCALLFAGMFLPVPYVVESPGPAVDVLGEYEGEDVLSIHGAQTYPTDGELMLTTVSVAGGPGSTVTPADVITAWFDPHRAVLPRELIFPEGQTKEQTSLQNSVQMTSSQQDAVAAALHELGIPYTRNVTVAGVQEGAPAEGVLEAGDVVVSVGGQQREDVKAYQELTRAVPAGQDVPMRVRRDGQEMDVAVPTREVDGKAMMGIVLAPGYDFPVDVRLQVEGIGGPSAGTMFSLAIYDQLTPGALGGGEAIAGTGTINEMGEVGPIGGIRQKMAGAREEGARYFLAPGANCTEVAGHVPDGLSVVRVDTFEDAVGAVETIGRTHAVTGLPTCEQP